MGLFSLDEVLQIAMQAEESGRLLYEAAARHCTDADVASLCTRLAAQEQGHFAKFKVMRDAQPSQAKSRRLSLEEMDFVQSLVDGRVTPTEAEARRIVRENSLAAVLDMAIQAEKDSVVFYRQILSAVDPGDAGVIRQIIDEEGRHFQILTDVRKGFPC